MVTPRRPGRPGAAWWTVALVVALALFLAWWLRTRRAEAPAPPASIPGARALGNPPDAPAGAEITDEEKAELQRILRERAGRPGAPGGDR